MPHYRYSPGGFSLGGMPPLSFVTKRLLIANIAIFLVHTIFFASGTSDPFMRIFALSWQGLTKGMVWQLMTYMFLHGGLWHLLGNMLGLFFFGNELETRLGAKRFLYLYLGGGILGALGWIIMGRMGLYSLQRPMIGASGAVFAIVGAFAALYPHRQITLLLFFVIPVTMTARMMAILFGGFSLLMLGDKSSIAHAAHLAGGIAGYVYGMRLMNNTITFRTNTFRNAWKNINLRDWMAKIRRSRLRVWEPPQDDKPVDWERVDHILVKIKAHGFGSLSESERKELDRASRHAEHNKR